MSEASKPSPPAFGARHEPRPLLFDPARLRGLSERLIRSHWENNYCGAVKALNAVEQRLATMLENPYLPPYAYGDLKREELLPTGSVRLHELHFANLGGDGKAGDAIQGVLSRAFGTFATWEAEFRRTANALAGGSEWAVLALGPEDDLHNYWAWTTVAARRGAARCWSSTCTSMPTTSTTARRRRATWTRSWRTSIGRWSIAGSTTSRLAPRPNWRPTPRGDHGRPRQAAAQPR